MVARPAEGTLRLVTPRRLYDHGVQVAESPSLAALVAPLVAKVNPADLEARGISSGTAVRLTADGTNGTAGSDGTAGSHDSAGSDVSGPAALEIEVVADPGVPAGVIDVSANVARAELAATELRA